MNWHLALRLTVAFILGWTTHNLLDSSVRERAALRVRLDSVAAERDAAVTLLGRHALQLELNSGPNDARDLNQQCIRAHVAPVLCRVSLWRGVARDPSEFAGDFLGVWTRLSFFPTHLSGSEAWSTGALVQASLPDARDASTFVLATLLSAIVGHDRARDDATPVRFVVADLGAGWGRWLSAAHAAAQRFATTPLDVRLIGVEAEPTHYEYMVQHLLDNGIDPRRHRLLHRVVHGGSEFTSHVPFYVGRPNEWYGQVIADGRPNEVALSVGALTIDELLRNETRIDWLQIDVGGVRGAFELVRAGRAALRRTVRWLVVRSVDASEHAAVRLALRQEWWLLHDFVGRAEPHASPFGGNVQFDNGLLVALNPTQLQPHQFVH